MAQIRTNILMFISMFILTFFVDFHHRRTRQRANSDYFYKTMAPFVYTGSGKTQSKNEKDPGQLRCTKQARAIQWCLSRRNHQEDACKDYIDAWKRCREKAVQQHENEQSKQNKS